MLTVLFVVYEREGVPRAEALRHWAGPHAELAQSLPGVRSYTQLQAISAPDGSAAPFLGVATLEFDDTAAFEAAATGPEFGALMGDLANFGDTELLPTAFVEPVKVIG